MKWQWQTQCGCVSVRLGLPHLLVTGITLGTCRNSPNGRKATLLFGTTGPWLGCVANHARRGWRMQQQNVLTLWSIIIAALNALEYSEVLFCVVNYLSIAANTQDTRPLYYNVCMLL
jgi:hypothetical protein